MYFLFSLPKCEIRIFFALQKLDYRKNLADTSRQKVSKETESSTANRNRKEKRKNYSTYYNIPPKTCEIC